MTLETTKKKKIIGTYQAHNKDTGSAEVQVALLTEKVKELTRHLKVHQKDFHSRQGLFKIVGNRRRLLNYIKTKHPKKYSALIDKLKIRK
ncbi:30S ribosomal protein S15 [candidate division Kazan bacterium RIFCSPHIGHO2_01_FULL_49_10]|uniref:Small ribosomal subunit protein uS15 n=1 Tax=candidate division Kazan bacterium RIFCSPLOWO2_01_FULL_48_13 TaxID=1798539 RepID=A0A1F4PNM2_UNCK3|nr:MAG: 30S ribosomal protein S15 [candidate division Kazan bacterium RIFCSPHIGHO2_01_FULL_49_10]OGB85196.1 MAG: 30S ribosomal protein S15 [candidate division Kazan bacterium RIFCSPLOWO2_01_FULL_48_13]